MSPLAVFNPPLGPNPKYFMPEETTLTMKEKAFSLSGDDFTIKTTSGIDVCKCKGKMVSLHDSKEFVDPQGVHLFTLKNKLIALHKSFRAEGPDGKDLFTVKGHFSLMSSKSSCHFINASDGREMELDIKGDWFDRSANITCQGQPVATLSREFFNMREMFVDKQTYYVTVAPGVDLTLVAAVCICLDERENEK
ncbi:DUF567-domain-containing protein [Aulographum hederae CBS 113979]|uniref:DUF567-domain-containing protein n=1 Tax=Aulographum hederae CBS 113979 TaxID=1176131 RepID=A0A6G1GXK3_9PEZI|nr:DUF567-domain-containing protein [Aulographum hederae CBS 113979]